MKVTILNFGEATPHGRVYDIDSMSSLPSKGFIFAGGDTPAGWYDQLSIEGGQLVADVNLIEDFKCFPEEVLRYYPVGYGSLEKRGTLFHVKDYQFKHLGVEFKKQR